MDLTAIVDALFWIMSILSAGFTAYGGWLCFLYRSADREQPRSGRAWARSNWSRGALPI
jgi:hypothetical protein